MGVTFVGAGPYGEAYLTLAGKQALQEADCILYDHLLDEQILQDCHAICIYVGKQAKQHSYQQSEINELLIEAAMKYEHVVRLKGGDSFIFGRGGEEALALVKHGIPYTLIPGLSSVTAVSELASIPLTHRGVSGGFVVLSAYDKEHRFQIQPHQVADDKLTVVIVMGLSRVKEIVTVLREANRAETTPIAIISQGASPSQTVLITSLEHMEHDVEVNRPLSPAIIVIGDVVPLRKQLLVEANKEKQTVYVTKVNQQRSALSTLLLQQGIRVKEIQIGEIRELPFSFISWRQYDTLVFTSRYAIASIYNQLEDIRCLYPFQCIVMGEKTAMALAERKIKADVIGDGTHETLEKLLEEAEKQGRKLLHVCGKQAVDFMVNGKKLPKCVVYENHLSDVVSIAFKEQDIVCFGSASAVSAITHPLDHQPMCISIGKRTTQALRKQGWKRIKEAKAAKYEAMMKEVLLCIEEED